MRDLRYEYAKQWQRKTKQIEQENKKAAEAAAMARAADRKNGFKNTGACLTCDGKIILFHATDADYSGIDGFTDYLKDRVDEVGIRKFAEELDDSPKELIHELLDSVGEDYCMDLVKDVYQSEEL